MKRICFEGCEEKIWLKKGSPSPLSPTSAEPNASFSLVEVSPPFLLSHPSLGEKNKVFYRLSLRKSENAVSFSAWDFQDEKNKDARAFIARPDRARASLFSHLFLLSL